jgi:enediyne biosynthesis protein E4
MAAVRAPAILLGLLAVAPGALAVTFEDAQDAAGIRWTHASASPPNYPETNGSGACWGDVDGDGTDDLVLVNGKYSKASLQQAVDPRSALYLNQGDGTFADASKAWGADVSGWGQGCTLADFDGDNDLDLLLVGWDMLKLLRNEGERLVDGTADANLTHVDKCRGTTCFGENGAWADYDRDGDLDLYVTNMVDYDVVLNANDPVTPALYNGQPNVLWRNKGDGTFEDVTLPAGVDDDPGPDRSKSFQAVWADHDRDGWPDLYIASDTTANTLFRNNKDGTFTDVAARAGVDDERSSMGLVFQDVDGDLLPDLFFTHYAAENNGFYTNDGDGTFTDHSGEGELGNDYLDVGWGAGFHDFDHDGDVDIYSVNGHTHTQQPDFKQKPRLWRNDGGLVFKDISNQSGPSFTTPSVARGSAVADHDLDGDLDILLLANHNATARLLEHQGTSRGWLQVEVREPSGMNRFAVGAEVTITPQGMAPVLRIVQAGNSFLGQDSMVVHAGLGNASLADVQVKWPDDTTQAWHGIAADQRVRLTKGSPVVVRDTLAPRTTILLQGEGRDGWFRGPVEVSLAAQDRAMGQASGVATTALDRGLGLAPYAGPITIASEGVHPLAARSTDGVGNVEPLRRAAVRIDATPPTTEASVSGTQGQQGWFATTALVEVAAHDDRSGVAQVWTRLDGGPWVAGAERVVEEGEHLVEYYAEDVAGNLAPVRGVEVKVDATPPAVRFPVWPLVLAVGERRILVEASDVPSGVREVAFLVGDETQPRAVDADGSDGYAWDTDLPPGLHRVRARATDLAGLQGEDAAWVLLLDVPALPPLPPLAPLLLGAPFAALRRKP